MYRFVTIGLDWCLLTCFAGKDLKPGAVMTDGALALVGAGLEVFRNYGESVYTAYIYSGGAAAADGEGT